MKYVKIGMNSSDTNNTHEVCEEWHELMQSVELLTYGAVPSILAFIEKQHPAVLLHQLLPTLLRVAPWVIKVGCIKERYT